MSKQIERDFKNILIVKPSAMGDVITALPILPALRKRYPSAKISWLISSQWVDLLRDHPLIDELLEFDRRRFGYLARSWIVTKRLMKFLRVLRGGKYDLVIDLQGLFRSGFFTWITQAGVRIGPAETRELGWVFYTHRCPSRPVDTHIVDRIGSVGELLDLDMTDPQFVLPVDKSSREAVGVDDYLVLIPGATWSSKRWPAEKFATLAGKIIDEWGMHVVLGGARGEKELCAEIAAKIDSSMLINLAGATKLPELVALIDGSSGVVCNDSGAMHVAVALGKPLSVIIGPTNVHRTGPYRRDECVLKSAIDCSPCYKRKCTRAEDATCMAEVSVEDVFENLASQLGRSV